MWLKRFTHYLLKHPWQTLTLIFVLAFVPLLGVVAIILAALITLLKGVLEGALATIAATLPYILVFLFYANGNPDIPMHIWASLGVAVLSNLLTWIFAIMLYRGSSWSAMLQIAALIGVFAISLLHYAYPQISDWWGTQLQAYYNQAKALASAANPSSFISTTTPDVQTESINATKEFATGFMAAAILANALMQLIVARWWQASVFNPGSLRRELHNIRLTPLAGALFLACMIFSYFGNSVIFDIMPVVYLLFFVAGLSIIHYFFGLMNTQTAWFWLMILYFTIIFAMPTSIILVAMVALLDIWWDVRRRFKKA